MTPLPDLSREELDRYNRHLILPEVGIEGQRKLKNARVLIIGAGGLGSPAGMYLAAAGIGHLGIIDFDSVDATNLQRQILYGTRDVDRSKTQSAKERLHDINPFVHVETFETYLTNKNALEILREYDVILDCTDNFPTRYLVNDTCVLLGKPDVYGSVFPLEGQASIFYGKQGACYRCLYPEPPAPNSVPSCAESGILGVVPGVIGSIQANEAIKLILGGGETLVNRLLLFDAWKMQFREVQLHKNPNCPICGEHPSIRELIDYELFCGCTTTSTDQAITEITATELNQWIDGGRDIQIIDVREPEEYVEENIPGAKLIPLGEIVNRASEIDPAKIAVVHCRSGSRSARAIGELRQHGFTGPLLNLQGGILAFSKKSSELIDNKTSPKNEQLPC
ncbi:MAG TPA: molybdopterin-synthase adenylyltransferase MoeB [Bacteroidota bacterium]|nr:molybdopterin-synthase adenylyltransferase MoeB [Bacteroidota bacterium]